MLFTRDNTDVIVRGMLFPTIIIIIIIIIWPVAVSQFTPRYCIYRKRERASRRIFERYNFISIPNCGEWSHNPPQLLFWLSYVYLYWIKCDFDSDSLTRQSQAIYNFCSSRLERPLKICINAIDATLYCSRLKLVYTRCFEIRWAFDNYDRSCGL